MFGERNISVDVKSCGNRHAWCSKCRPDVATWVRSYAHTAGQPLGYKLAFQANFWRRVDKRAKAECWNWKGGLYRAGGHGRVISRRYMTARTGRTSVVRHTGRPGSSRTVRLKRASMFCTRATLACAATLNTCTWPAEACLGRRQVRVSKRFSPHRR